MVGQLKIFIMMMGIFMMGWGPVYYLARAELRRWIDARFVIAFALVILVGLFAPNSFTYFLAVIAIVVGTVRSRTEAMCRYVQLVGLAPAVFWQATIGSFYLTPIDTISMIGLGAIIAAKIYGPRPRTAPSWSVEDTTVLILFLILLTADRPSTATIVIRSLTAAFMAVALPYLVLRSSIRRIEEFRPVIACIAVTVVILAVFAVYEARTGWAIFNQISLRLNNNGGMSLNIMHRGNFLRASGPRSGPLEFGCYLVFALTALLSCSRYFKSTPAFYAMLAIGFFGVIVPQSRGSLLTFVVVATLGAALLGKWATTLTISIGGAVGGLALLEIAKFSTNVASFLNVGEAAVPEGEVYDYRQLLLQRGLEEGMSHPIFGIPLQENLAHLEDIKQGQHIVDLVNTYLTFFLTSGLVGMVPLVLCLLICIGRGLKSPRRAGRDLLLVRFFAVCSLLAVLVQLTFVSFIGCIPYLLVTALFALKLYSDPRARSAKAPSPSRTRQPQLRSGAVKEAVS